MTERDETMGYDVDAILGGLKAFQRRTVEYCFRRMYEDARPTSRMLVADEVGLGKTMVARGIIAKTIDHLRHRTATRRIDIVYVCSNAAIAKQNVNRLNIFRNAEFEVATRLTLLPVELKQLQDRDVNFVSFTPSTTFELKSRGGVARERVLLYFMLKGQLDLHEAGLRRLLRGAVGTKRWARWIAEWNGEIESSLHERFLDALEADTARLDELRRLTREVDARTAEVERPLRNRIYSAIGALRALLARVCVDALEPDLIILDEFQRFRDLLDLQEPSEAALLAQALMGFRDADTDLEARVLMLSATPYRMYTTAEDEDDDHHEDFLATMRFLLRGDEAKVEALKRDLAGYRRALYAAPAVKSGDDAAARVDADSYRARVEACLRSVMVRTERVGATRDRDAMLAERQSRHVPDPRELLAAASLSSVAQAVGTRDVAHYWKSSPYVLNFMRPDGYQLKKKLVAKLDSGDHEARASLAKASAYLLEGETFARYARLDPGHARMRALVDETVGSAQWRCLWIPPSLPYTRPEGPFAAAEGLTKSLVFSAWQIVPDAIATICSYEAERRMLESDPDRPSYADLHEKRTGLLQYRTEKADGAGRLGGMTTVALMYPCRALARLVDPLALALQLGGDGAPPTVDQLREAARTAVRSALASAGIPVARETAGKSDQRWYWAALARLDQAAGGSIHGWVESRDGWRAISQNDEAALGKGFALHLNELAAAFEPDGLDLDRPPDDLVDVLADLALGSPGVVALRALERLAAPQVCEGHEILTAAATLAEGLRTLFNQPTAMALLRGGETHVPYWRHVVGYALHGNLQAVLDEYVHVLREATGHGGRGDATAIRDVAASAAEALSLRTSRIGVDDLVRTNGSQAVAFERVNVRTRFALRFGDLKDDSGQVLARAGGVRQAFNSPFPPFVLASTSVGQEGLDFHCYCHRLYHWNLPSNPVDLEQREGRVQRFKGHAIRRNVARDVGLSRLRDRWDGQGDPWDALFALAAARVSDTAGDLIPYWIYEGESPDAVRVERRVPLLTMSREVSQLRRLKRGLALYRLAFGQPRQEEMLEYLQAHEGAERIEPIRLAPEG